MGKIGTASFKARGWTFCRQTRRSPEAAPQCVQKQHLALIHSCVTANTVAESGAAGVWEETSSLLCDSVAGQCKYFSGLLEHSPSTKPIVHLPETESQRIVSAWKYTTGQDDTIFL